MKSLNLKLTYGRFLALVLTVVLVTVGIPSWANVVNSVEQPYVQTTDLIRQAQQDYERGQFWQAVDALETSINRFEHTGESLQKAVALGNLSLAYQGLGIWSEAQDAIEQSLHILGVTPDDLPLESTHDLEQPSVLASTLDIYGQLWQKQGDFAHALEIWQQAAELHQTTNNASAWLGSQINQIRALETLGLQQQARVKAEHVGCTLGEELEGITCSVPAFDPDALPSSLKAQGLRSLGDTLRQVGELELSRDVLEMSKENADNIQERQAILLSLGNTYETLGTREKERATSDNRQGIIPWRFIPSDEGLTEAEESYQKARTYFSQVIDNNVTNTDCPSISPETSDQIQLTAGVMCLSVQLEQNLAGQVSENDQSLWNSLYTRIINETTPNRALIYTTIRLAKQGAYLNQTADNDIVGWDQNQIVDNDVIGWDQIIGLLNQAISDAQQLQDKPAESYARGNLGGLYEYFDWVEKYKGQQLQPSIDTRTKAETFTQEALLLAQPSTFPEIAYQWQWQLARLTLADDCVNCSQADKQVLTSKATSTYEQAIDTLEQVREGLLSINADIQFSFRDNIEPIYRELVDLKLQADHPSQKDLQEVVNLIDKLQISELESFLRCRLTPTKLEQQDIDPHAAVLYPIILRDRMEVILALPDGSLHRSKAFTEAQSANSKSLQRYIDETVAKWRRALGEYPLAAPLTKAIPAQFYTQLIRPFESELETRQTQTESNIKTLVFVLDGALRNLPMSVLQDTQRDVDHGGRYLIERYAIAVAPSLQLIDPEPLSRPLTIFAGGSSFEERSDYRPIPYVRDEIDAIQQLFKGSETLLNQALTSQNLIQTLTTNPSSIVHLATHGRFSSDPTQTYIVLADGRFYAADFNTLLKQTSTPSNRIKLLVLSACQTAEGDKRAVLGMAGLAVQSGASATLSTLWSVKDKSAAALVPLFYEQLKADKQITKAEALRQAQLRLRDIGKSQDWNMPLHWAPYTIVGNWR